MKLDRVDVSPPPQGELQIPDPGLGPVRIKHEETLLSKSLEGGHGHHGVSTTVALTGFAGKPQASIESACF
jgi:hypothetical protein